MKKFLVLIIIICISILCSIKQSFGFWVWTPETNKWINPKYEVKETPKAQLEHALSFFESGDYDKALREMDKLIKHYPKAKEAADAQFYIARCHEQQGDLFQAFQAYQTVLEKYPFSERNASIIEAQYNIGVRMLEGEGKRNKFLAALVGGEYPVVEVFQTVIKNAPYSQYAPEAQYKIGLFLKEQRLYQEARDAFEKVINDYPDSDWVKSAKYQIALADTMRSSDAPYDQRTTQAAVEEFQNVTKNYPGSELSKKAKEEIKALREKEAENNFLIGRFYEKSKDWEAAEIYYSNVVKNYEDTPWAIKALERLRILEVNKQR